MEFENLLIFNDFDYAFRNCGFRLQNYLKEFINVLFKLNFHLYFDHFFYNLLNRQFFILFGLRKRLKLIRLDNNGN